MATPSEIRTDTLNVLRQAKQQLNSPTWISALEEQSPETRRDAAMRLLDVQSAKLRLEIAELAAIRDGLVANESELASGRTALTTALDGLEKVAKVLEAIRGLIGVVQRVLD